MNVPRICPDCGANLGSVSDRCWLCHAIVAPKIKANSPASAPINPPAASPVASSAERDVAVLRVVAFIAALAMSIGLAMLGWGYMILFLIVAVPALCVIAPPRSWSGKRAGRHDRQIAATATQSPMLPDESTSPILHVLLSIGLVIGVLCLLVLAIAVALFFACVIAIST